MRQGTKIGASYFFMLLLLTAQLEMAFHGLVHHHSDAKQSHHHCAHDDAHDAAENHFGADADDALDAHEDSCLRCGQFIVHSQAISPQGLHCIHALHWEGSACIPRTEWVADLTAHPIPRGPPVA